MAVTEVEFEWLLLFIDLTEEFKRPTRLVRTEIRDQTLLGDLPEFDVPHVWLEWRILLYRIKIPQAVI